MSLSWQETTPSAVSPVGTFPTFVRNVWQTIAAGMAVEHYWPGAGAPSSTSSIGELLPGASRAFVAPRSAASVPSLASIGRLFLCSDTSQLLLFDSGATFLAGSVNYDEVASAATGGFWARISQTTTLATGASTVTISWGAGGQTFKFLTAPTVVAPTVSDGSWLVGVNSSSVSQCVSYYSSLLNAAGTPTLTVEALGIVSSASF